MLKVNAGKILVFERNGLPQFNITLNYEELEVVD